MHIHGHQPSVSGNPLAGAHAAEKATALKRARELREAAVKLKATSQGSEPDAVRMIGRWHQGASSERDHEDRQEVVSQNGDEAALGSDRVSYWA